MKKNVLSNIIGWCIAFIIISFLLKGLLRHWDQIKNFNWDVNYWLFAACIPFLLFNFFWSPYIFLKILKINGAHIDYRSVFKITTIANLGAYIPGKIWGWLGLAYFTKKAGLSYTQMGASIMISQVLRVMVNLLYGIFALLFIPVFSGYAWIILLAVPVGIILIHPLFMKYWLNVLLGLFKQPPITIDYSVYDIFKVGCLFMIGLIAEGIGFAIFSNSIILLPIKGTVCSLFLFPFAIILGYLAIIVPGGIGIRESIIMYGLSSFVPTYFALVIAFGYRLIFLFVRILPTLLALKIKLRSPNE